MPKAPRRPVMPRNRDRSGASLDGHTLPSSQQPGRVQGQRGAAQSQTPQRRPGQVQAAQRGAAQQTSASRGGVRLAASSPKSLAQPRQAGAQGTPQQRQGAVLRVGTTKIDRTPPAGLSTTARTGQSGQVGGRLTGGAAAQTANAGVARTGLLAVGTAADSTKAGHSSGRQGSRQARPAARVADRPGARPDRGTAYSARRRPDRPGSRQTEDGVWQGGAPETGPAEQVEQEKAMSRPMAALVLVACMVMAAFIVIGPLRTLMEQRAERAQLVEQITQAQERNEKLRQDLAKWEDPNVVRHEARERLGFVQPGERVYIVTDPSVAEPGPSETTDPALRVVKQQDSWVLTLWQGQAPSSIPLRDQPTSPPGIIKQNGE